MTEKKKRGSACRSCEERFHTVIQRTTDGIVIVDDMGKILFSNPVAQLLIGQIPEVRNGKFPFAIPSKKSAEITVRGRGGRKQVLEIRSVVTRWGGRHARLLSVQDMTARMKAERQLKKALSDLRFALASEKVLMEELDRKNKALVELSITDGLTHLYNHRFLQERFDFELKRLRRYGGSLSIMLIDIDLFKAVNDTYGHQFGDFVLRELATLLKSSSREVDICGRYGGEEFMIITNLQAGDIMSYASRLHRAVEDHKFSDQGNAVHITVSIGIAEYGSTVATKQELIERADQALYQAKKDGRNLIRLWKEVEQQDDRSEDRSGIEKIKNEFVNISAQMRSAYMEATDALINAVDAKNPMACEHSHTVSRIGVEIARYLNLPLSEIEVIKYAGLLHDIGKIGIRQEILTKTEPLTQKEFDILKRHPIVGYNILRDVKFLEKELPIILHHHERYDGSGYPYGLKEREIPLGARILGVADAFDAMTAGRSYKKGLGRDKALQELRDKSGTQFAPEIVDAFIHLFEMKKV